MRCNAADCAASTGLVLRRYTAAATAVTTMTNDTAGASRQDRQNSTTTAPAASKKALKPRSLEQLLQGTAAVRAADCQAPGCAPVIILLGSHGSAMGEART
jgi:hypothetical protein